MDKSIHELNRAETFEFARKVIDKYNEKNMLADAMVWSTIIGNLEIVDIPAEIADKFHELANDIEKYESDTFSAEGYEITKEEARQVATALVMEDLNHRVDLDTMDGLNIRYALTDIRDDETDN